MFYDDATLLVEAAAALRPSSVVMGFTPADPTGAIPTTAAFPILVLPDGGATFIQVCSEYLQQGLDAFATGQTRFLAATPADLLRGMVAEDPEVIAAYLDWARGPEPVPWQDRRPEERLLDPEETPAEVLAGLHFVAVIFAAPQAWWSRSEVLCTRATLGWNECVSLRLGESLETLAYAVPGEPLDVVILPEGADLTEDIAVIGQIPAEVIAGAGNQPIEVEILAATLEEALAAAARGERVLRVP